MFSLQSYENYVTITYTDIIGTQSTDCRQCDVWLPKDEGRGELLFIGCLNRSEALYAYYVFQWAGKHTMVFWNP